MSNLIQLKFQPQVILSDGAFGTWNSMVPAHSSLLIGNFGLINPSSDCSRLSSNRSSSGIMGGQWPGDLKAFAAKQRAGSQPGLEKLLHRNPSRISTR